MTVFIRRDHRQAQRTDRLCRQPQLCRKSIGLYQKELLEGQIRFFEAVYKAVEAGVTKNAAGRAIATTVRLPQNIMAVYVFKPSPTLPAYAIARFPTQVMATYEEIKNGKPYADVALASGKHSSRQACYALNMASRLQVAPEEYLATSFDGTDREYVRGEIVERSMPDYVHGRMQAKLLVRFGQLEASHRLYGCSETRMLLAPALYRIPDVAVFAGTEPEERVPSRPPLVAIEIVSPGDRYSEMLEKLEEYQQWGVAHIWVIDPHRRTLAAYEDGAPRTVPKLALTGYPFELSADLFS